MRQFPLEFLQSRAGGQSHCPRWIRFPPLPPLKAQFRPRVETPRASTYSTEARCWLSPYSCFRSVSHWSKSGSGYSSFRPLFAKSPSYHLTHSSSVSKDSPVRRFRTYLRAWLWSSECVPCLSQSTQRGIPRGSTLRTETIIHLPTQVDSVANHPIHFQLPQNKWESNGLSSGDANSAATRSARFMAAS